MVLFLKDNRIHSHFQTTSSSTSASDGGAVPHSVNDEFTAVLDALSEVNKQVKMLTTQVKLLQRRVAKEQKELEKMTKGRRKKVLDPNKPKRAPSGFAKPTYLSKELSIFLGVSEDTLLARTEVTKKITGYVKEHDLQNPANKKEIVTDQKLGNLLNVPDSETLTYFNLQRYMKFHFNKGPEAIAAAAAAEAIAATTAV